MKISKFKYKTLGKGSEKADNYRVEQQIEILNYVPHEYMISKSWSNFNGIAERYFRSVVRDVNIDDLNCNMFDALIESEGNREKAVATKQYTHHLSTIKSMIKVLKGQVLKAQSIVELLNNDVNECDSEIKKLQQLKDNQNII